MPDLDAHVTDHPWREEGWRLLALALYRSGRQGEALDVLRRARTLLVEQFGVDPGAALQRLETGILQHEPGLELEGPDAEASRVWAAAAAMYHRTVASGSPARLRSTVELLRSLAITGGSGLEAAREQRLATIRAAEELGDPALTARVIGAYDVPAIWSRSDDADQAAQVIAAAERTLAALGSGAADGTRARLLATIAVESRGAASGTRAHEAAFEAEAIARRADEPALLAFALNGRFMQSFAQAGLADSRAALGAELVELASRRDLPTFELLGHLIRMQALSALGDFVAADAHAQTADRLAEAYESPLVGVFTGWYRALRLASSDAAATDVATAYRDAARRLDGAGMPGLQRGLLPSRCSRSVCSTTARRPSKRTSTGVRQHRGYARCCCSPAVSGQLPWPSFADFPLRPATTCSRCTGASSHAQPSTSATTTPWRVRSSRSRRRPPNSRAQAADSSRWGRCPGSSTTFGLPSAPECRSIPHPPFGVDTEEISVCSTDVAAAPREHAGHTPSVRHVEETIDD